MAEILSTNQLFSVNDTGMYLLILVCIYIIIDNACTGNRKYNNPLKDRLIDNRFNLYIKYKICITIRNNTNSWTVIILLVSWGKKISILV